MKIATVKRTDVASNVVKIQGASRLVDFKAYDDAKIINGSTDIIAAETKKDTWYIETAGTGRTLCNGKIAKTSFQPRTGFLIEGVATAAKDYEAGSQKIKKGDLVECWMYSQDDVR